jgi:outer membrane lipoprotein-sorting protein
VLSRGRRGFLAAAAAFAVLGPRQPVAAQDPNERPATLARVEAYLNSITTMKASFLQVASTGDVAQGTFYMRRPGRLRIEYPPPSPALIVGDGHRLIYYDKELKSANMMPIEDTLAGILVRERVRLSGDIAVAAYRHEKGTVSITLRRKAEPEAGSLDLVFNDAPLRLRLWIVTDAHGTTTRVSLSDAEFGVQLSDELFTVPEEPQRQ